jgi:hypothetical protein
MLAKNTVKFQLFRVKIVEEPMCNRRKIRWYKAFVWIPENLSFHIIWGFHYVTDEDKVFRDVTTSWPVNCEAYQRSSFFLSIPEYRSCRVCWKSGNYLQMDVALYPRTVQCSDSVDCHSELFSCLQMCNQFDIFTLLECCALQIGS